MLKREHKVSNISSEAIFAIPAMKPARVVSAIIFCLCLIISDIRYDAASYIRSYSKDILTPISFMIGLPQEFFSYATNIFSSKTKLDERIDRLEEENLKLKTANQYTQMLSSELSKLNKLWSSTDIDHQDLIISKKTFLSSNFYQPLLVLDMELGKTIKKNNAVLSDEGLVGRVENVGIASVDVMLIQDIRSSIPVVSEESSLHAVLQGKGLDRKGELKFIKKTASFSEGELLFTSGLGDIFPEGLQVGRISSIRDLTDSEFLKIEVSLFSSPIDNDYFLITTNE